MKNNYYSIHILLAFIYSYIKKFKDNVKFFKYIYLHVFLFKVFQKEIAVRLFSF
jgi:hypothetical protein